LILLNHQLREFHFLSERYREAIPLLEAAYQINPGNHANAYDLARAREQVRKMLANADKAEVHRLLGDLDERLGDLLGAVRENEMAARLDPSEQNYFEWGTELLLHRAAGPAVEVFTEALTTKRPAASAMPPTWNRQTPFPTFSSAKWKRQRPRRCPAASRSWRNLCGTSPGMLSPIIITR
jgi:tetratricopeptide (TPR) repeat protein